MLTEAEHALVDKLGSLMNDFRKITGFHEPNRDNDLGEVGLHVHALQNMVLAQCAAREYQGTYRLMGDSVREPRDWAELGEDVSGHAMFHAVQRHDDGRQCAYHQRLRSYVFSAYGSNRVDQKCLRPHKAAGDWHLPDEPRPPRNPS